MTKHVDSIYNIFLVDAYSVGQKASIVENWLLKRTQRTWRLFFNVGDHKEIFCK